MKNALLFLRRAIPAIFMFALAAFAFGERACAENTPKAVLSEENKKILQDIEKYFNGIKSIKSDFSQVSATGAFAEGKINLLKPDRMRLEYAPPYPVEIIADGHYLIFHDKKLEQVTYLDLDDNPASIILKENFSFKDSDLTVEDISRSPGFIEVTVFKTEQPAAGKITLVFRDRPLALKQWQITDAQKTKTLVSLNQAEFNVPVDEAQFVFKDPYKSRPGDRPRRNR